MSETLFQELKRYVGFGEADEAALKGLHPIAQPHFKSYSEIFYQRILEHDGARQSLVGGESVVGHLKVTLQAWMDKLLSGPWDEDYYELRCRIGRMHVRIALPQHYMFGAMNVIRQLMNDLIDQRYLDDPSALHLVRVALGKILDLELAIMLHTYREDLLTQRSRQVRLATFGQLVGSMGHELRNPLGVMETSLHILKGRLGDDERARKHAERIGTQITIANKIVSDLLDMIRDRPLVREQLSLAEVVEAAVQAVAVPEGLTVELHGIAGLPPVNGDRGQLRQLFINLLDNAVQACAGSGRVAVVGSASDRTVRVAVEDTGPGVDPATRLRLFEPLVTTKEKGVGLGLALVKRIVERHEGSIDYEPRDGGGARFVVRLPTGG
ncbi:MAG: GHKL domain-containing protein [Archangiaceae bacterium]|nr:GHKL domain-containing protein [Archangiaceae bacterium]